MALKLKHGIIKAPRSIEGLLRDPVKKQYKQHKGVKKGPLGYSGFGSTGIILCMSAAKEPSTEHSKVHQVQVPASSAQCLEACAKRRTLRFFHPPAGTRGLQGLKASTVDTQTAFCYLLYKSVIQMVTIVREHILR